MRFSSTRGRPKIDKSNKEIVTPELAAKHKAGLTQEPLDSLLKKGVINDIEHKAGSYLRRLYTLRFSQFHIKACDYTNIKSQVINSYDEDWVKHKEQEYEEAINILYQNKAFNIVTNLCLFNQFPKSLTYSLNQSSFNEAKNIVYERINELSILRYGLHKLAEFFGIICNNKYENNSTAA